MVVVVRVVDVVDLVVTVTELLDVAVVDVLVVVVIVGGAVAAGVEIENCSVSTFLAMSNVSCVGAIEATLLPRSETKPILAFTLLP